MNKNELVKKTAKKNGLSQKKTEEILDSCFDEIAEALSDGNEVMICGFGTFSVKKHGPRNIKSVETDEQVTLGGYRSVSFSSGSRLKRRINKDET